MLKPKYGVTVKEASQQLGISEAAVRILMKRGKLPIGMAIQMTGVRYTYYISQDMLDRYIRGEGEEGAGRCSN